MKMSALSSSSLTSRQQQATTTVCEIPHIVHQFLGSSQGSTAKESMAAWKKYHPNWNYRGWSKGEIRTFIMQHYPSFIGLYDQYPYDVQRDHMARYMILSIEGGVFCDSDLIPLKPVTSLFPTGLPIYLLETGGSSSDPEETLNLRTESRIYSDRLMASVPHAPIWNPILKRLANPTSPPQSGIFSSASVSPGEFISTTTGPLMLTEVMRESPDIPTYGVISNRRIGVYPQPLTDQMYFSTQSATSSSTASTEIPMLHRLRSKNRALMNGMYKWCARIGMVVLVVAIAYILWMLVRSAMFQTALFLLLPLLAPLFGGSRMPFSAAADGAPPS